MFTPKIVQVTFIFPPENISWLRPCPTETACVTEDAQRKHLLTRIKQTSTAIARPIKFLKQQKQN